MQYRLDLIVKPAEGALVRVIGMVERRGFVLRDVQATPHADGRWRLQMQVDSTRPGETLRHQLEKVYDCESVTVSAVAAVAADAGVAA
ncbi:acetolactate synthase, small subunit [Pseudoxanthomonas sp. GM95]|uniref:ACT domain-containing protein n=1 Tax=Pseudoxanthomonas sp. GM95 TaxID=1881043 RepID=UPI0008CD02CE|nr:ACT domain-containing protein [Pseudoxanthomonas sp. GM95]SEL62448.1 acetolactate synthase, small subunit [Pseudoxanthomonas sp. GM95]